MKTSNATKTGSEFCAIVSCDACAVSDLCAQYLETGGKQVESVLQHYQPKTEAGEHIYWAGDQFDMLYAVKSGCVKTYTVDEDGNERIRGFYLPGDLLAFDALYSDEYTSSACAVVTTQVCSISYAQLCRAVVNQPKLQQRLLKLMSKDLATALALAGDYTAEQRMAAFILHLYEREQERNIGKTGEVELLMPRRDIANFLRLAPETASRVLSRFQKEGLIESSQHTLKLLDTKALRALAQPVGIVFDQLSSRKAA